MSRNTEDSGAEEVIDSSDTSSDTEGKSISTPKKAARAASLSSSRPKKAARAANSLGSMPEKQADREKDPLELTPQGQLDPDKKNSDMAVQNLSDVLIEESGNPPESIQRPIKIEELDQELYIKYTKLIDVLQENASKFLNKISSSKINVFNENDEQVLTTHEEKEFIQLTNRFLSLPYRSIKNIHIKNKNFIILEKCCINIYLSGVSGISKAQAFIIAKCLNNFLSNDMRTYMSDIGFWKDGSYHDNRLPYLMNQIKSLREKAYPLLKNTNYELASFYGKEIDKIKGYPSKDSFKKDKEELQKEIKKIPDSINSNSSYLMSGLEDIKRLFIYEMYFKDSLPQDIKDSGVRIHGLILDFIGEDSYPKDEFDEVWRDLDLQKIMDSNDNPILAVIKVLSDIREKSLTNINMLNSIISMSEMLEGGGDTEIEKANFLAKISKISKKAEICKSMLCFLENQAKLNPGNIYPKDKSYEMIKERHQGNLQKINNKIKDAANTSEQEGQIKASRAALVKLEEQERVEGLEAKTTSLKDEVDQIRSQLEKIDSNSSDQSNIEKRNELEQLMTKTHEHYRLLFQEQQAAKRVKNKLTKRISRLEGEIKKAQSVLEKSPKEAEKLISLIQNIDSAIQNRSLSCLLHNTRLQNDQIKNLRKKSKKLDELFSLIVEIEVIFPLELEYRSSMHFYRNSSNSPGVIKPIGADSKEEGFLPPLYESPFSIHQNLSPSEKREMEAISNQLTLPKDLERYMNSRFIKRFIFINKLKNLTGPEEFHMLQSTICNFTSWIKVFYENSEDGKDQDIVKTFYKKIRSEQLMHFFTQESSVEILQDQAKLNKSLSCMRQYAAVCQRFLLTKPHLEVDNKDVIEELSGNLVQRRLNIINKLSIIYKGKIDGQKTLRNRSAIDITNLVKNRAEDFSLIFSWQHPNLQKEGEQNRQLRYRNSAYEGYRTVRDVQILEKIEAALGLQTAEQEEELQSEPEELINLSQSIAELEEIISNSDEKEIAESGIADSEILALQHLSRIFTDLHNIVIESSSEELLKIMSRDIFHEPRSVKQYNGFVKESILIDSYLQNIGDLFSREPLCSKEIIHHKQYEILKDLLFYIPDYRINKGHICFSNQDNILNILKIVKDRGPEIIGVLKGVLYHALESADSKEVRSSHRVSRGGDISVELAASDSKSSDVPSSAVLQPAANSSRSSDIDQSPNR